MTSRFMDMKKRVGDALDGHGFDVKEKGNRTWRIDHDGTAQREVAVELHDRWLCFHEPLLELADAVAPSANDCWSYVRTRPFATSRGKVAVDPTNGGVARLREEIPLGDGVDLSEACRSTVSSFASARTLLNESKKTAVKGGRKSKKKSDRRVAGETPGQAADEFKDTLEDLCTDTGWAWSERGDGSAVVNLDVPAGAHQARLEVSSEKDYRIAVELNQFRSPSDVVRSAVAVFLLSANDLIHFARCGVDETEKGMKAFLEVCFFERPSPVLFDEALCALSVGVRFCGRELGALGDERVAQSYLRIRGWSPNGQDPSRGRVLVSSPGRKEVGSHV